MISKLNSTIDCIAAVDEDESTEPETDQIKALLQKSHCGSHPGKRKLAALVVSLALLLLIVFVELLVMRTIAHTDIPVHKICVECGKQSRGYFGKVDGRWTLNGLNVLRTINNGVIILSMVTPLVLVHYPLALTVKDGTQSFLEAMTPIEWVIVGLVAVKVCTKKIRAWNFAEPPVKLTHPYMILTFLVVALTVTQAFLTVARYRSDHFDITLSDVAASMARDIGRRLRAAAKDNKKGAESDQKLQRASRTECTKFDIHGMRKLMYAATGTFTVSVCMTTALVVFTRVKADMARIV